MWFGSGSANVLIVAGKTPNIDKKAESTIIIQLLLEHFSRKSGHGVKSDRARLPESITLFCVCEAFGAIAMRKGFYGSDIIEHKTHFTDAAEAEIENYQTTDQPALSGK